MPNPPTKDNLESSHFLSQSAAVRQRLTRSDSSNIRPFSPPSEAIQAVKEGLNRVQPRIPGMPRINDPENTFGESMRDAVYAYKSFNGIVRTGQPLDPIVGRMTLARLDTELKNLGRPVDPKPVVLEFGSSKWRFSFFCNRGFFGKGIYQMFIGSTEVQDSRNFDIDEVFAIGALVTGFKGETRGNLTTTKKMHAKDYSGCMCDIALTRASELLQGTLRLEKIVPDGVFGVSFLLPRFRDETLGLPQGTSNIRGNLGVGRA